MLLEHSHQTKQLVTVQRLTMFHRLMQPQRSGNALPNRFRLLCLRGVRSVIYQKNRVRIGEQLCVGACLSMQDTQTGLVSVHPSGIKVARGFVQMGCCWNATQPRSSPPDGVILACVSCQRDRHFLLVSCFPLHPQWALSQPQTQADPEEAELRKLLMSEASGLGKHLASPKNQDPSDRTRTSQQLRCQPIE